MGLAHDLPVIWNRSWESPIGENPYSGAAARAPYTSLCCLSHHVRQVRLTVRTLSSCLKESSPELCVFPSKGYNMPRGGEAPVDLQPLFSCSTCREANPSVLESQEPMLP